MGDKVGQVCLTTLEYAVLGSPLLTTHCPSCGLKLVIQQHNLASRITSVSLLLGMFALVGYNMAVHNQWLQRLGCRLLGLFARGHQHDEPGAGSGHLHRRYHHRLHHQRASMNHHHPNTYPFGEFDSPSSSHRDLEQDIESKMSDHTEDSAIDLLLPSSQYSTPLNASDLDDLDEGLFDLIAYSNNNYSDYRDSGEESDSDPSRQHLRTQTVDKIDQVLHQIDDIKKSIVEIDDELYQIAGATYASFNPNFFTLTDSTLEEFDSLEYSPSNRKISEDRLSQVSVHSQPNQRSDRRHQPVARSVSQTEQYESRKSTAKDEQQNRYQSHTTYSSSNSDVDSLQLEWDFESEYDCYYYNHPASARRPEGSEKQPSPLREKLTSAATGLEMPMTDEQKLRNMHDLLDEAKKLGLLNNILDALSPSKLGKPVETSEENAEIQMIKSKS